MAIARSRCRKPSIAGDGASPPQGAADDPLVQMNQISDALTAPDPFPNLQPVVEQVVERRARQGTR